MGLKDCLEAEDSYKLFELLGNCEIEHRLEINISCELFGTARLCEGCGRLTVVKAPMFSNTLATGQGSLSRCAAKNFHQIGDSHGRRLLSNVEALVFSRTLATKKGLRSRSAAKTSQGTRNCTEPRTDANCGSLNVLEDSGNQ